MRCRSTFVAGAVVVSVVGVAVGQVGFQPATELVAVEPPPGNIPLNAGQVILGMATRYVFRIEAVDGVAARIGVTADFSTVHQLAMPDGGVGAEVVAVSDDGTRVLGRVGFSTPGLTRACVWDNEQPAAVIDANGLQNQAPMGMSSDGQRLLIRTGLPLGQRSVLVDNGVVVEIIPGEEDPSLDTSATSLSRDGRAVAGMYNGSHGAPFIWTVAGGVVLQPPFEVVISRLISNGGQRSLFAGFTSSSTYGISGWRLIPSFSPRCINEDGSQVLGAMGTGAFARAAVWSETLGVESLRESLVARGIDVRGWTLTTVEYVSPDGRKIVGRGTAPSSSVVRRWVATVEPFAAADMGRAGGFGGSDGRLDNNDFIVFIDRFFAGDERADCGRAGGERGGDGEFDNNDFCVFISLFFGGEP